MVRSVALIALASAPLVSSTESDLAAQWAASYEAGTPFLNAHRATNVVMYEQYLPTLDIAALTHDIKHVMKNNKAGHWPADFGRNARGDGGNYGPLFVRLAWHCSGTYRLSDGKGGCGGGGQRFEPLRSWDDNTNLDKARALLAPIKTKYGDALSWGDLIVAAGTISMRDMGAPLTRMCFGRMDDSDGGNNEALGENGAPCNSFQGNCQSPPWGAGTTGLIYVNPEGPVIEEGGDPVPDPVLSAADIRDVFGRMGDDDRATVALIGGGHAFGKSHGACDNPNGQGIRPSEAFAQNLDQAWVGTCGEGDLQGVGPNTVTAGFEGPWTTTPTQWGNEFFRFMLPEDWEWEKFIGPGGHNQWRLNRGPGGHLTAAERGLLRLTTDVALIHDDKYLELVREYAADLDKLGRDFSDAWFKLTHRGGRWTTSSFCDNGDPMPQWVMDQNNNNMLDSDTIAV